MHEIRRAVEAAHDARGAAALSQEYYRAVIYRIITGFTWSDSDILQSSLETQDADTLGNLQTATDTWKKLALAIGFMFRHATKFRNELRKLASTWIRLSSRHLDTIIDICHPHGNGQVAQANQALGFFFARGLISVGSWHNDVRQTLEGAWHRCSRPGRFFGPSLPLSGFKV
jgi:hypothetical protein